MVRAVGLYPTGSGFESQRADHVKSLRASVDFLREPREARPREPFTWPGEYKAAVQDVERPKHGAAIHFFLSLRRNLDTLGI